MSRSNSLASQGSADEANIDAAYGAGKASPGKDKGKMVSGKALKTAWCLYSCMPCARDVVASRRRDMKPKRPEMMMMMMVMMMMMMN